MTYDMEQYAIIKDTKYHLKVSIDNTQHSRCKYILIFSSIISIL